MTVLIWIGAALLCAMATALIGAGVIGLRTGGTAGRGDGVSATGDRTLRRARRRGLVCLGTALVVLVVGVAVDAARPSWLGLPLALAPGLAAAGALAAYALLPATSDPAPGPVTASLTRRTAWSYGSRRGFAAPGVLLVVTLGFLGWATLVADPDDLGRMRAISFVDGPLGSSAGPFPGSFYGLPLALATVLLAAAGYAALRRISMTPTLTDPADATVDRRWRTASSRLVVLVATAGLAGYLGGAVFLAGAAIRSAGTTLAINGGHARRTVTAGTGLTLIGVALLALAVVAAVLAVGQAFALRSAGPIAPGPGLVAPGPAATR